MSDVLQRLQSAKRIGFVFSGGSARCAFQIGVIERLAALGLRASVTAGTSAGAWNAALVASRQERRVRYFWKTFVRYPHIDLKNILREHSPWRYADNHRRNFARFIGARLHAPEALPCFVSVMRLRDQERVILRANEVDRPVDLLLASNYLPPFYTHTPLLGGERYGDGAITDNAPYEVAFEQGCDMVVLVTVKGESEGGIYKNARDIDHEIPAALRNRVVVIRPRHRMPCGFVERRWPVLSELVMLGDLRAREVLLGETHPETERIRAEGEAISIRLLRLWRSLTGGRGRAGGAGAPAAPAQP